VTHTQLINLLETIDAVRDNSILDVDVLVEHLKTIVVEVEKTRKHLQEEARDRLIRWQQLTEEMKEAGLHI
jgi:hypothetical protein